jgi:glycosyltransferase involved in cell wall biosynthesis
MSITNGEALKTIGIFNDSFPPIMDGVSLAAKNYAHWLHQKNQPVCVVTPKSPHYSDNEPYPIYRYTSIPIIGRKPYRMGLPDIDFSFQNQINKIPFGLVHAHCPFSSGKVAQNIAKKQNIPIVATFHSKYREDFEHSVYNKFIAKQMTNEVIRFYEKADEVWISQASVEETIREYGFKGKLEIVPFGNDFVTNQPIVPLKKQARKELNLENNELIFLFVGQHIWEKNTKLIIESLALIKDLPFKMFFVGNGYAKNDMMQLSEKLGLGSKVEFLGVITEREKLKQIYAAADLFLFPSTYDTWALVIREAAALGTPSVLIESSTISNVVTNNFNGFLTQDSTESFATCLRELISTPEIIASVGLNASKSITRSWENVTEEVIDRYQNLIKRKCRK